MPWRRWGAYVSERQWGTVREDYSDDGDAWDYFPHTAARSRTYRWGEDGIAGISDTMQLSRHKEAHLIQNGYLCDGSATPFARVPVQADRAQ